MSIESGQTVEINQENESVIDERDRIQQSVYRGFIRGTLTEEEAFELLKKIEVYDPDLKKDIPRVLAGLSDTVEESMRDIDDEGRWQEEFNKVFEKIQTLGIEDSAEIKYARSFVAHHLCNLLERYQQESKPLSEFVDDVRSWMEDIDTKIPDVFEKQGEVIMGKRQPGFRETVEETLKRYLAIEKTVESLKGRVNGVIFGGSMSYGPFFNVRGNYDKTGPSDLDGIIVMKNIDDKIPIEDVFGKRETDEFSLRQRIFEEMYKQGEAQIITQKSRFKDQDFDISIHFFPPEEFSKIMGEPLRGALGKNEDVECLLKDYRSSAFVHPRLNSHNFDGSELEYETPETQEAKNGVVNTLPAYRIKDGKFYSGVYQNVVSPGFDVWYDRTGEVSESVNSFKKTMIERMEYEHSQGADTHFEKSHIRQNIFSPHFIERINKTQK